MRHGNTQFTVVGYRTLCSFCLNDRMEALIAYVEYFHGHDSTIDVAT